jgi:hypothetical protein
MAVSRRTVRIIALAAGIPVLVIVLLVVLAVYALGGFRDNVAQDALNPITNSIVAAGGHEICDEGDAGYGPDNREPWYKVLYAVPDAASARTALFAAAAAHGYALTYDTSVTRQSAHQRFYASEINDQQLGLNLVIYRDVTVPVDCQGIGPQRQTASGAGAIYEVQFNSPDRQG